MNNKTARTIPAELFSALKRARICGEMEATVYNLESLYPGRWYGVIGNGDNGFYEWFAWSDDKLEHSSQLYGASDFALRDILIKEAA